MPFKQITRPAGKVRLIGNVSPACRRQWLTMHPGQWITFGDNCGFLISKLGQAAIDLFFAAEGLGKANVGGVVSRLGFKQAAIELGQLVVFNMITQQAESLARPCLDQASDQEAIDRPLGLELPDTLVEPASVATGLKAMKSNVATFQNGENQVEMLQLLVNDRGHFSAQLFVVDVGKNQVHRHAGGLFFAMRVIDQNLIQVLIYLTQPTVGGN